MAFGGGTAGCRSDGVLCRTAAVPWAPAVGAVSRSGSACCGETAAGDSRPDRRRAAGTVAHG